MSGTRGMTLMGDYQAAEESWLQFPAIAGGASLTGRRCLVLLHGRTSQGRQPAQWKGYKAIVNALCDPASVGRSGPGYVVMSIDAGSNSGGAGTTDATSYKNGWNADYVGTAISAARTNLITTRGASGSTKIGILEWSLGAGQGFYWGKVNPTLLSGIVSFAPATDYTWLYNNFSTTNSGGAAEIELSYAATKTTTIGSGTLNQVGSNLTITSGTGFAASGSGILYTIGDINAYTTPVKFTYTGGGGTATLTGCTIATGSRT
jgi:hypothetical protein